jgi:hypothetical protein
MSLKSSWTRIKFAFAFAVAVGTAGAVANFVGCGTTATTTATTTPYLYTSYYPADVAYSSVYWADDWAYTGLYALYAPNPVTTTGAAGTGVTVTGAAGVVGTAGAPGQVAVAMGGNGGTTTVTATGAVITTPGDVVRALARGESVCPGQVTVTPKTVAPACTGGTTRAGVTIVFTGCLTPAGTTINGTLDVASTRTASATTCSATTSIMLSYNSTLTNLSYTGVGGGQLVIPSMTTTGMTTYTFGQTPPSIALNVTGELQTFASGGAMTADHNFTGSSTFSFGGSATGYSVDGSLNVVDNLMAGAASTITVTGLQRVQTCCRPVGGTVGIVQTSGTGVGTHTWTFSSTCGSATIDGTSTTLPACI